MNAATGITPAGWSGARRALKRAGAVPGLAGLSHAALGIAGLFVLWGFGGWLIAANPATASFADFAPLPTLAALAKLVASGDVLDMAVPSLMRIAGGLGCAILIGVPLGIAVGRFTLFREATHIPFQLLRMVSPLSWMPIAVLAFPSWDGAIVFLLTAAAVWPVTFATASGLRKVDPAWFKVARNLGARGWHMLIVVIMPAISQDVLTGIRLALGVAWIVLVPAEFLGVTSGLGYAINDARDTLSYDRLTAVVLVIGVIGLGLDWLCVTLIRRYSWIRSE